MSIRKGIFLIGYKPTQHGISGALDVYARIDNQEQPVIAKQMSDEKILAEIFCALLGRSFGLVCPEPVLLIGQADNRVYFGSIKHPGENLGQYLKLPQPEEVWMPKYAELLNEWPSFGLAVAFDECIRNPDRNIGNILWSDEKEYVLIDHENALNINPHMPDINKILATWIAIYGKNSSEKERFRIKVATLAIQLKKLHELKISTIVKKLAEHESNNILEKFEDFTLSRLKNLQLLINQRFSNDLFRGPN
jgi:hypothetical protein